MFEARLRREVEGSPLEEKFPTFAEVFLERRSKDPGVDQLKGPAPAGLARVLATSADAARFLSLRPNVLQRLVDTGNTVVIIEHHLDVMKNADWIIDLGPGAGDKGGYIVATGTPEEVARVESSATGQYLVRVLPQDTYAVTR